MGKKPWPADAVMIVCSIAGTENGVNMESVNLGICRDCKKQVAYDGHTMSTAEGYGRPVQFFCVECAVTYDRGSITDFIDERGWKPPRVRLD